MLSKSLRTFTTQATVKPRVTQLLINGKFVNSKTGKTFDTFNPSTEESICKVQETGVEDVDIAVKAARKAFDEGPWRRMAASDRARLMYKLADLIEKHQDELAALESLDNGKPVAVAKAADIHLVTKTIR